MAQARDSRAWDHTATILVNLVNLWRAPGEPAAKIMDFHPHRQPKERLIKLSPRESMQLLHRIYEDVE